LIPRKLEELAKEIIGRKILKEWKGEFEVRTEFSPESLEQLGIKFFASVLKLLSNEDSWKILRNIKGNRKLSSTEIHNLQDILFRLHEHGLITSQERRNIALTQLGEEVLTSHINLLPYAGKARSMEQNIILLRLLLSRNEISFSELEEKLGCMLPPSIEASRI
jgi:predicted transcriptional regulator